MLKTKTAVRAAILAAAGLSDPRAKGDAFKILAPQFKGRKGPISWQAVQQWWMDGKVPWRREKWLEELAKANKPAAE